MVVPKFGQLPGGSGVQLFQASFRAMGRTIDVIAAGASPPGTASPIAGTGSARIDPAIPLLGGVPGVSNLSRPLSPSVVVSGGQLGGTINVARSGKQGIAFAVLASLPTASYTFPGVSDPVWIDATSGLVNMFGIAYGLGTCPVAEQLHAERFIGLGLCTCELPPADVKLMIAAFRKVWSQLDALRGVW